MRVGGFLGTSVPDFPAHHFPATSLGAIQPQRFHKSRGLVSGTGVDRNASRRSDVAYGVAASRL